MLEVRLFGRLEVALAGRSMAPLAGPRPRSLLAWLLAHPGRHARGSVAARFWPGVLDTSARASLRSALWTIRAALAEIGAEAYLDAGRDVVGIDPGLPRDVDLERFRSLGAGTAAEWRGALEIAAEPLLVDLADDWVLDARDALRREAAGIALALADTVPAGAAIEWLRRAVGLDRLDESLHRRLIAGLAAAGEPAQALAAYRRCRDLLAAEFGTAPSAATRALVAQIREGQDDGSASPARGDGAMESSGSLVGRDSERAALAAAWRAASAGAGGVAVIRGAPGIGKTELARDIARAARAAGGLVGAGQASGPAAAVAFGPWSEALGELVAGLDPPDPGAAWPAQLARICAPVETHWSRSPEPLAAAPDLARAQLFEALAEMLRWASARAPVLLLLDDLHWADDTSVAVLANLGRRAANLAVLMVVTERPAARDDLAAALAGLRRGGLRAEIELGPMLAGDLAALAGRVAPGLDDAQRRRAADLAGGNPLLAAAAARALGAGRDAAHGLRPWVAEQRRGLGDAGRLLTDLAAVAGRPLGLDEIGPLVDPHDPDVAIEAATGAHLLALGPRGVAFRHDLVRAAGYAEIEGPRRSVLHRRLAEALRARPRAAVGEVARHLVLGGDPIAARGYLEAAAVHARALGAFGEATAFLREAVAVADHPELAAGIWLQVAEVESWRGDRAAHDAAFARVTDLIGDGRDPALWAGALAVRGRCLRTSLCYPRESGDAYRAALVTIEAAAGDLPELRAVCTAGLAWSEAQVGDIERAQALIAEAEELSRGADDPVMALELAIDRATVLMRRGDFAAGEREALAGAALAGVEHRPELIHGALSFAAIAAAARGDFPAVLELAERGLRAGRSGFAVEAELLGARTYALSRMGRDDEARAVAAVLGRAAAATGQAEHEAAAALDLAHVAHESGRPAEAAEHLRLALAEGGERIPRALARLRLAEGRLAAGDVEGAAAELERFPFEPVRPADSPPALVPRLAALEGRLAAARGDPQTAADHLERSARAWRRLGADATAQSVVGMVDLGRAPVAGLIEPGLELGRVLFDLAALRARAGERSAARRTLAAAMSRAAASADPRADARRRAIEAILNDGGPDARP